MDVGYSIELFADLSGTGKAYVPFPDSLTHRIQLADLETNLIRTRLRSANSSTRIANAGRNCTPT